MPRPSLRTPDTLKMADKVRRPTTLYRPKSRTDSSSPGMSSGGARLESRVKGDEGGSSDEDLARQNTDLRQRLHEEASVYRKRLDTYRQAQQNQAALVSRLQAKVLQYKQRCSDLEAQMTSNTLPSFDSYTQIKPASKSQSAAPGSALEQAQQHLREMREERITDLDIALSKLEEERKKCDHLIAQNKSLREQLEESHQTNEELTVDLQKLTNQFEELREEMLIKEDEWKDEEQAFNDYYSMEHNRLLNVWRNVVSIKRLFMDVQSTTEKDLNKLKSEIGTMGRDVAFACGLVDRNTRTDSMISLAERPTLNIENSELKTQIELIKSDYQLQKAENQAKEDRIQNLLKEVQDLEERCSEAENNVSQIVRMQDEVELMQGALRDIAHALIQDAETKDLIEATASHLHLSASTPIPQKSPKRGVLRGMASSSAFAESTISAVQAALHKYKSFIHELQVKLQTNREQLLLVRKQCEHSDEKVLALENRVKELVGQLDTCRIQCTKVHQERETLQKNFEAIKSEKQNLDKNKQDLHNAIENLNSDYDKLQKVNHKLQKEIDVLSDEKIFLHTEIERLNQEGNLREMNLRAEEDRCSRIREEFLTTREELNKLYLSHDMLEQQKLEAESLIQVLEKTKLDYELQLEKALGENSGTHDSLIKKENLVANLEFDKKKLQEELRKVEQEKMALHSQCNDHQNDIQSLKKELLQAEKAKLDLESDKLSLLDKIKFVEIEKGKIEMELGQTLRDRSDLSNQLTVLGRKRDATNEELLRTKQKLEQVNETNARINRNLEELVNESEEKQCALDAMDKEMQRLQDQLTALRTEKESLEGVLFDTQTNLEAMQVKKSQLEQEQQELLITQESLKGQVARLKTDLERSEKRSHEVKTSLLQQAGNQEVEFQHTISNLKKQNDDSIRKLIEERDTIRTTLEKKLQQSLQRLGNEKDTEIGQLVERIENLQSHIENVCQQHEELMLRAENDKQQALLIAHHDHQALLDRLEETKRELESEKGVLERLRRDANSKFDQDRTNINQLKDEMNKLKSKLEENRTKHEEEKLKLNQAAEELRRDRESAQADIENYKSQIHLCEDKIDSLNNQLHETIRKLKEVENNSDSLRKDLTDTRRQLTDSTFEKEKYHTSNKELREFIKTIESEKRDQARQLEEAHQKISSLEDIKVSLDSERARLQNHIRDVEKEQVLNDHKLQALQEELKKSKQANNQQQAEEKELQTRLLNEVEERERFHQEVHTLKKQLSELERSLEQTRQELGRTLAHSAHLEEQWHAREQDLVVHLEDCRSREKRLEDQKHNLEVCLVDATQHIQDLKTKLGASESRVKSLDVQLGHNEAAKKDVEQKLTSVVSTLRRIAGIQLDGSINTSHRLLSPSRRWSPARSGDYDAKIDNVGDIDPEVVRKGVRNLMHQVAQVERERDDFKMQVNTAKKQLKESQETQNKGDGKLHKAMQNMRILQEEKGSLEAKLSQKIVALNAQNDTLQKKNEEVLNLRDKVTNLEMTVGNCKEEKMQNEDKIEKLKVALGKVEMDKRGLQEELGRVESRSAKLELQRMSCEGDLQRLKMVIQEKDSHIQKLQEKCELQSRTLASLEERCVSLKSTIDQLNLSLEKASCSESELKVEIQSLQRSLLETTSSSHAGAEKLKNLQKSLANCENERKILSERQDASQQTIMELRRNNQILNDQILRLNTDLTNNEVQRSGLESQLRIAQWPGETSVGTHHEEELLRQLQTIQRERNELRGKVDSLANKIRLLESENRNLERVMARGPRSKSYERQEKYELDTSSSDKDSLKFEQENRELRIKISRLETELTEREAEIARLKARGSTIDSKFDRSEIERYRTAQLQAERLLEAREQSHRQQIGRLENQLTSLREQLNQEIKRRQQYILRSTRAGREMQHLRQALGDSLRTVSQDPSLDAILLEQEARKLDNTVSSTASLPPALNISSSYDRALSPQPPNY